MAPCPDAEVTALAPQNKKLPRLSVGSPATEIIRRNNQYMLSFSKDTLHCPKIGINEKNGHVPIPPVSCWMQKN